MVRLDDGVLEVDRTFGPVHHGEDSHIARSPFISIALFALQIWIERQIRDCEALMASNFTYASCDQYLPPFWSRTTLAERMLLARLSLCHGSSDTYVHLQIMLPAHGDTR